MNQSRHLIPQKIVTSTTNIISWYKNWLSLQPMEVFNCLNLQISKSIYCFSWVIKDWRYKMKVESFRVEKHFGHEQFCEVQL